MTFYVLISGLSMGIFYLYYNLLLKNNLKFCINRSFLLFAVLFSTLLPLIQFNVSTKSIPDYETVRILTEIKHNLVSQQENMATPLAIYHPRSNFAGFPEGYNVLFLLYLVIVVILAVRFISNLCNIILRIVQNPKIKTDHAILVLIDKAISPYSFFNFIFINKHDYHAGDDTGMILEHEKVHVRNFHSADIILVEFIKIFLWFNPFIYLYKRAIQENQEYAADYNAIEHCQNKDSYKLQILKYSGVYIPMNIICRNSMNLIQKRLKMLNLYTTKKRSLSFFHYPVMFFLALLMILIMGCNLQPEHGSELAANSSAGNLNSPQKNNIKTETSMKKMDITYQPRWMSLMSCIESSLTYLDIDYSTSWLYGITGQAFIISMHRNVCPSSPSVSSEYYLDDIIKLGENAGYKAQSFKLRRKEWNYKQKRQTIFDEMKKAVDQNRPCFATGLDIEYCLITGYDESGIYYINFETNDGYIKIDDFKNETIEVYIISPGETDHIIRPVKESIRFALKHNNGKSLFKYYRTGLQAYDTWIDAIQNGTAMGVHFGMGNNAGSWHECRRYAIDFLIEAKSKIKGNSELFDEAISFYAEAADNLMKVAQQFSSETASMHQKYVQDKNIADRTCRYLIQAKNAEEKGLQVLQKIEESI